MFYTAFRNSGIMPLERRYNVKKKTAIQRVFVVLERLHKKRLHAFFALQRLFCVITPLKRRFNAFIDFFTPFTFQSHY